MLLLASLTMGVKVIKTNGLGEKGQRLFLSVQWQKWQEFKSLEPCTVTVGDNWFLNLDAATKWQCSHSANAPFSYICFSYFNCAWHQGKLGRNFFDLFFDFKQACTISCWMFWFPYLSSVKLFRPNKKMHACWLAGLPGFASPVYYIVRWSKSMLYDSSESGFFSVEAVTEPHCNNVTKGNEICRQESIEWFCDF